MKASRDRDTIDILIAEDSKTQAYMLKYVLESNGFSVSIAYDGSEAFQYLEKELPRIVLSDILMPEMNGYQLCRKIKSDEKMKHMPVMLLTSLSEPEDIIHGLECGADSFITKPYDEEALVARINYILLNAEMRKHSESEMGIDIIFAGKKYFVTSSRIQILDLLLATYEATMQKTRELEKALKELRSANETIKTLKGFIPICASCKQVRDDKGYWKQIERYISENSDADFTHTICPDCTKRLYPDTPSGKDSG
jgi:two-component system, OmpR family, response regulator VanR